MALSLLSVHNMSVIVCLQFVGVLLANIGQECAIIKAVDEVERDAEEAKWGNVASKVLRAVGWKYPALSLKDKYAAMCKSGFAYIASNPNNSQPT